MSLTGIMFLLLFSTGLILCLVRHPIFGLYTYIAVFYLDAPNRWWGDALPDLRWSFISAAVTLIAVLFRRNETKQSNVFSHMPVKLFLLYVIWMWVQSPWVLNTEDHFLGLNLFTKYLVVIYIVYKLIDSKEAFVGFFTMHVLGCFYLAVLAYTADTTGRLDGIGGPGIDDASSLGMQMATAVFAAATVYLITNGSRKWLAALSVPFLLNCLVLSGSRGAFLSLTVGSGVYFYCRPPGKLKIIIPYIVLGLGLFVYVASTTFWERMETISVPVENTEDADKSIETRLVLVKTQFQMFKDYPFGVGHRGTTVLSYDYLDESYHSSGGGRSSHSTFMSALVDQGFPGFIIWITIVLLLAKQSLRTKALAVTDPDISWINASISAGIAVVVVAGLFAPLIRTEVFIWLLALSCSLKSLVTSNFNFIAPTMLSKKAADWTVRN